MSKSKTLIPKTVVQIFSETIYDYYTYILDNFVLPVWVYHLVRVYITFSTCLLFTNFHQSGTGIKPLEVFLNLYATDLSEKWATINFVIDMILYTAIYTSIGYHSLVFTKKSHLSKTSTYLNVICVEVIIPILLLATGSQIGNNVGLIYKNMKNYLIWVYTIILLFWLILTLIFHNLFLCSYIHFVPGRTFTLSAALQGFDMNVIISVRLFARCANALNGTIYAIGFRVAIALVLLFGILIILFYNVYINRKYSGFICATFCAGFVLDVISIFVSLDWVIRLLIFSCVIMIGNTAIYNVLKAGSKKAKEIYDAFENEELEFEDVYPKLNDQFLKHCYEAFKMGHPYFFTFKPILNGAHHENTNKKIWKFYLRVLAIYNNKIYDLMNASQAFKRLGFNDLQSRLFIRGIDHIIDIRSRKVTKQCKNIMKNIQSHTRTLRTTLVRYWQAIESDEPGSTYAYGSSAQNQMDEIDRMYESVLTKWPNCAPLFKHYAKFLNTVCFNKLKGEQYNALAAIKRSVDMLEIRAKRCFPLIPLQVESDNLFQPNQQQQQQQSDQASLLSTGPISNSSEIEQNEEQEAELVAQNTLYEMGKNARVPVNTAINVIVVVAFIFLFIMGIILADVVVLKKYYIYETLLRFLSCFTSILFYTSRPVYRIASLVTDALGISYDLQKTT
ncbi:hypothetical protein TVAG_020300 [Trichomonas vaginalis G3]|uniref:Uncharacterized protein n=1 Tax=Trichomonas vaginalis (strain ATCC PRA-98 / G3) TaxID=412133 RepID=A2EQ19_TRIV3|nr:hypothetical protein TVAGG3_0338940 [Trichomonas vaginalis G3]EAY05284.1 hypothetical protein TVAG_020300 [Trichomonas vaginalis G3]KAI5530491.1 hypothetical protein TVAGG3_0338940 [Trichomonas vaginalis G3]|eukprot:XP_001317507.1 hypothetical protein [Trichomonas vaginalis G3]